MNKTLLHTMNIMKIHHLILLLLLSVNLNAQQKYYYPAKGADWELKSATEFGIDTFKLNKAVDFAKSNEYKESKDLRQAILKGFERENNESNLCCG